MYRSYEDGVHVLMGSYTDKDHRGKGTFKTLLNKLIENEIKSGETIQIALTNKKILNHLLNIGFEKTSESVRHWGNISNGVNLKMIKK
jgi:GNAT superfamily N-acetyltransferase